VKEAMTQLTWGSSAMAREEDEKVGKGGGGGGEERGGEERGGGRRIWLLNHWEATPSNAFLLNN
jgi:hypothetical protein